MSALADNLAKQFAEREPLLPGADNPDIRSQRNAAFAAFIEQGLPTVKVENWKYTDLTKLKNTLYAVPVNETAQLESLDRLPVPIFSAHRAIFIDGEFASAQSSLPDAQPGVTISTLKTLLNHDGDANSLLASRDDAFSSLNSALAPDGLVIEIDQGAVIEEPLQVIFVTTNRTSPTLINPKLLVSAGANSAVTIIESHCSIDAAEAVTNAATDVVLKPGARVVHYRTQTDQPNTHHIGQVNADLERDSTFETYSFAFGGGITRVDVTANMNGPGANAVLDGLFLVDNDQHIDHHTTINHYAGNTQSSETYRGIADGNGRGVFNGKIFVAKDAQKIEAEQSSKNLLLSNGAEIDTKPELEIYADDVKCAHGATVGQLDESSFFYLRSRGIDERTARSILTFAFAADIAEKITLEPLRSWVEEIIVSRTHASGMNEITDND